MRPNRNSMRARLMLSWHVWACVFLFFYNSGSATARLATATGAAASNHRSVPDRGLQATAGEPLGGERRNLKEEDKDKNNNKDKDKDKNKDKVKETESPTGQPSATPMDPTKAPTTTEGPTKAPTTAGPTESSSIQQSFEIPLEEVRLLPFSIMIHGSLSMEDELEIRGGLQDYLAGSFLEAEDATDSIVLEMVQMVESYIPTRERSLSQFRGRHIARQLQSASSTSTTSTLVQYESSAILRFKQQQEEDAIDDKSLALEELQIEVLENTGDLQEYFLDVYRNENDGTKDPVVLMEVQIDERPLKSLNSQETWKTIESIMESSSTTETSGSSSNNGNSFSEDSNDGGIFSWKVIVGIVCGAMILIGLVGICLVRRKKKKQYKQKKALPEEVVVDQKVTVDADDDDGVECSFDAGDSASPVTFSRSFLRKGKTKHQKAEELHNNDGNGETNLLNITIDDDESMMGFSLSSQNQDANVNGGQQDAAKTSFEDPESMSVASAEGDAVNNTVVAGVLKILQTKANDLVQSTVQPALDGKNRWNAEQDVTTDTFETEDMEGARPSKHGVSNKEVQSVASPFSCEGITANISKYYEKDELVMPVECSQLGLIRNIETTNSEEAMMENPCCPFNDTYVRENAIDSQPFDVAAYVPPDNASDAPSDERNNGPADLPTQQHRAGHTRYTNAAIRNSKLVDNDPAVLNYLSR